MSNANLITMYRAEVGRLVRAITIQRASGRGVNSMDVRDLRATRQELARLESLASAVKARI
jgi:hypothetical protein